jgi:hypothetical protein
MKTKEQLIIGKYRGEYMYVLRYICKFLYVCFCLDLPIS